MVEVEKQDKRPAVSDTSPAQTQNQPASSPNLSGGKKMAENKDLSQGISESFDRAESAQRRAAQTARGMFESFSDMYGSFLSLNGTRRMAEVYIDTSEKIANETLDYGRKFIELSAGGARRFWQVAEEQRREARQNR